jgi:endoglucanase
MKKVLVKLLALPLFAIFTHQTSAAVNYGESLQKSIYFYEAQQSGVLPAWNRTEWRGNSTVTDGNDVAVDLSGGWYDAGDHVKFGFPMASSATLLAWGVVDYPAAYTQSGQMKHIKNNLKFVADYFVKAHPSANVLYGQVGTGSGDHAWWGPVEAVNETSRAASIRPSFAITEACPGTDLAGETAAALASIAMVFKDSDVVYSNQLITHAKQLYDFAYNFRGKYSSCITDASGYYNSWSGYNDELVWSAIWLYRATGEQKYLDRATTDYANLGVENQTTLKSYKWTQAWDDKSYGSYVLMAKLTGKAEYRADAERWLDFWTTGYNGDRVKYTPGGLAQLDRWGANRYAANTSFMALVYSDFLKSIAPSNTRVKTYYDFAVNQLEYILGKNPNNQCYQIGMCANGPRNPHHRTAHGSWADSLAVPAQSRHLLVGALVGGPSSGDAYADDRADYVMNEVATDYNAGFTSAVARLYLDFGGNPIPDATFPAKEIRDTEYFVEAKVNSSGPRHMEISSITHNRSAWPAKINKNLKFRYWVDLTSEIAKGYRASDITITAAFSQAKSVSNLKLWGNPADNIYYTEVSFDGVSIFPGGQSDERKEVQFRFSLPTNSDKPDWNNNDDPSWDTYGAAFKNASKIALYSGDTLVWGSEPKPACGGTSGINCAPKAVDLSVTTAAETAVAVTLSATDADGTIASYATTTPLNGVLTGTGASRSYKPNANYFGTDSFTYTAKDNAGAISNVATVTIKVDEPIIPSVSITSPTNNSSVYTSADVNLLFTLKNADSAQILLNGTQIATGIKTGSYTFKAPAVAGNFVVDVVALNAAGNALSATASITLTAKIPPANVPPTAVMTASTSGLAVTASGAGSTDPDSTSLTYAWDFGDTKTATGVTATHTYSAAGTYTVTLSVSDGIATTSATKIVTVTAPPPAANCKYIVNNEWNAGFVATIRITNNTTTVINGWQVTWQYPAGSNRTSGWNAVVTGTNPFTATALDWNRSIQPGQFVEFGMQGTKPDGQAAPVPSVTGPVCQ